MLITNFASGELSPTLNGRVDLQQYYQGAGFLQNFEIIPTGGIRRRVGSQRLKKLETSSQSRLIPFIVNKNISFILELSPGKLNIWYMNLGSLTKLQGVDVPYATTEEISELQYAQNYDTMVMVHRGYKPRMLKYSGAISTGFTFGEMSFDYDPDCTLDDDFDYVMVPTGSNAVLPIKLYGNTFAYNKGDKVVNKTYKTGQTPYCVFKGHLYEYDTSWSISGTDPTEEALFNAEGDYPGCVAFFNNRLFLGSTINKPQKVWASSAPDTTENRYNEFPTYQKYVTVNQVVKEADLHIFSCDMATADKKTLINVSQDFTGIEDITSYYVTGTYIPVGTKVVSCTANTIVLDTDVNISEDTENQVCSIQLWKNADAVSADDYNYQVVNNNITTADCSFNFELASDENDAIMFITSGKFLAIGTESSIWAISTDCTATNISASMQGRYGSDNIQGMAVASAQIYFAQGKRGIREFYYDSSAEAFQTNNIAIMAEQMLEESEVVDFDYITNPYNRILCLRYDGTIADLLYDKNNGVMGWTRQVRGVGKICSVAVVRGDAQYDIPFHVVQDNGSYYIERIDNNNRVFLDSWQVYSADVVSDYTSDAVIWNENTQTECPANNIPDGFITGDANNIYIGYKYESDIVSLPILANDTTGKKRITSLLVRFLNSYLPVMKCEESEETFSGVDEPYSGICKMTYPGVYDRDVTFDIATDKPQDVVILSVNAQLAE